MIISNSTREKEVITDRKKAHLDICIDIENPIQSENSYWNGYQLRHKALGGMTLEDIDLKQDFLGYILKAPFFISSMTGGSKDSYAYNKVLAEAAQKYGIPVGMGSIRILLKKPEIIKDFQLKKYAPDVPVFSNISAVQLRDQGINPFIELNKVLEVDAMAIHLNIGQELFQKAGDVDFTHLLKTIDQAKKKLDLPIIVKETGFGMAVDEIKALLEIGVDYVDLAGSGGTNWLLVEAFREGTLDLGSEFQEWGYKTGYLLDALAKQYPKQILASGGLKTGSHLAKSLSLGAHLGGYALPFIQALALEEKEGLHQKIEDIIKTLKYSMLLSGASNIDALGLLKGMRNLEWEQAVKQIKNF